MRYDVRGGAITIATVTTAISTIAIVTIPSQMLVQAELRDQRRNNDNTDDNNNNNNIK